MRWLCYSALLCESNPPARAAAGQRHSVFIDGEGRLSSCGNEAAEGEEDEEDNEDEVVEASTAKKPTRSLRFETSDSGGSQVVKDLKADDCRFWEGLRRQ